MTLLPTDSANQDSLEEDQTALQPKQLEQTTELMSIDPQKNARKAICSPASTSNSGHTSAVEVKTRQNSKKKRTEISVPVEPTFASDKSMAKVVPEEKTFRNKDEVGSIGTERSDL